MVVRRNVAPGDLAEKEGMTCERLSEHAYAYTAQAIRIRDRDWGRRVPWLTPSHARHGTGLIRRIAKSPTNHQVRPATHITRSHARRVGVWRRSRSSRAQTRTT